MKFRKLMSGVLTLALLVTASIGMTVPAAATETDPAAQIGDTKYASVADAVKAVPKNATAEPTTITMLRDEELASTLTVGHSYAQNIIIDLDGHTLSYKKSVALRTNREGTTLEVKNGTVYGNSTIGTLSANNEAKLILGDGLTITTGPHANALYVDNGTLIAESDSVKVIGIKGDINVGKASNIQITAGSFKHIETIETYAAGCKFAKVEDPEYGELYKINASTGVAKIEDEEYDTLDEAIKAAVDGDIITLISDINVDEKDVVDLDGYNTFFKVDGKSITIDLNGKKIYADASKVTGKFVVGVFSTCNGGELTLKDSAGGGTVQGYSGATQEAAYLDSSKGNTDYNYKFYTLLASYNEECPITIEGGSYILDFAGDSLMYTSGNEGIVVNGGTFQLGNLGGIRNGMPWVFNARGQNQRHAVVNGGSFCADIQHQYYPFEVYVPKELALKNENDMYTIAPAVAYVTEREWSGKWYTNNVGYATLQEAIMACEGPKTSWNGQVSEQESVILLKDINLNEVLLVMAAGI